MTIFLDTGFFIGFYNEKDQLHSKCRSLANELQSGRYGGIYTSIFVINELITYLQRKVNHKVSCQIAEDWFIKNKKFGELIESSQGIISRAVKLFIKQSYQRKPLSFTDCIIVETCKKHRISKIITFDTEFKQYLEVIN